MDLSIIAFQLQAGDYVLQKNLAAITHEQSLLVPHPAGNCLNWVLGHMVRTRNRALSLLQPAPAFDDQEFEAYAPGSLDSGRALRLETLRARFTALGPLLAAGLRACPPARLNAPAPFSPTGNPNETVATLLASIAFHEAYHLGQTGLLRRWLGHPGAILGPDDRAVAS